MILTNFTVYSGSKILGNDSYFIFSDKKRKNAIFQVGVCDDFSRIESESKRKKYGDWNLFSLNGTVMRLRSGVISFFSSNNLGQNLLVYRIKKKKVGIIKARNKYCYIVHDIEVDQYMYFFIVFVEAKNIDFEVCDIKGKMVGEIKQYRKEKIFSSI